MLNGTVVSERRAALRRMLAQAEEQVAFFRAELGKEGPGVALQAIEIGSGWPADADDPDLISTGTAAARAKVSDHTIRRWCRLDGIGKQYGPHYRVSVSRLRQHLAR